MILYDDIDEHRHPMVIVDEATAEESPTIFVPAFQNTVTFLHARKGCGDFACTPPVSRFSFKRTIVPLAKAMKFAIIILAGSINRCGESIT